MAVSTAMSVVNSPAANWRRQICELLHSLRRLLTHCRPIRPTRVGSGDWGAAAIATRHPGEASEAE
jgi:hypothetical protein